MHGVPLIDIQPFSLLPGVNFSNSIAPSLNVRRGRRFSSAYDYPLHSSSSPRDLSALLSYSSNALPWTNSWTDNRIEQIRAFKLWTYVAINTIAKRVAAQVPNVSWVRIDDKHIRNKKALLSSYARTKALLPLQSHEQLEVVPHNHPAVRLLKSPNDEDTSYDLWYETILFLFLTGSAYWWTPRNALGYPCAIHVVPSHWMWPIMGEVGEPFIKEWEIRPVEGNYLRRRFPTEEITVFRFKNPFSKIDGYAPNTAGAQWHDVSESVYRARFNAYRQGTFANIAVQFDGKLQDPSPEDMRRIEAKFYARAVGESRAGKPLFLPPGVTAKPLNILPNQMVFGETAIETRDNTLSLYGVPLAVINASGHGIEGGSIAAQAGFHSGTVNPLCKFLSLGLTERFLSKWDPTLRGWWEEMTPDDPNLIEKRIQTDGLFGAITTNEIRVMRGREPYPEPWADRPLLPVNMAPLTHATGGSHAPTGAQDLPHPGALPRDPDDNKKHLRNGRVFPSLTHALFGE